MGILIFAGAYAGQYLDGYLELQKPFLTAALSLVGLAAAFYIVFKDLNKDNHQ